MATEEMKETNQTLDPTAPARPWLKRAADQLTAMTPNESTPPPVGGSIHRFPLMLKQLAVWLCFLAPSLWGYTQIPETIQVGHYTVSVKVSDTWHVQVFAKQGAITYNALEPTAEGQAAVEIRVYRVSLPQDLVPLEGAAIASRLVREDGLKFQQAVFHKWFQFPKDPVVLPCPAGTAFVYGEIDPSFYRDREPHFARAALILPPDYKSRKIGYFVVAHQAGGGSGKQAQKDYFDAIIQCIREKAG